MKLYSATYKLSQNQFLPHVLGQSLHYSWFPKHNLIKAGVGWGYRQSTKSLNKLCQKYNIPFQRVEEGFIYCLPQKEHLPLSFVIDQSSIYYNAYQKSDLDQIITYDKRVFDKVLLTKAKEMIKILCNDEITKYNYGHHQSHEQLKLFKQLSQYQDKVLVIDQTQGDMSISLGGASEQTFELMLETAIKENPGGHICVKVHPGVITGKKRSCFQPNSLKSHTIISENINSLALLKQFDIIYTVTSQMGFEALMLKKKVICFGLPFYARWGLTDDRHPKAQTTGQIRTMEQLFIASYMLYPQYIDIDRMRPATIDSVLEKIQTHCHINKENEGTWLCLQTSLWKRDILYNFLKTPTNQVYFIHSLKDKRVLQANHSTKILIWGYRHLENETQYNGIPLYRVEDGFLRSVGLGSSFNRPYSLVIEPCALYYRSDTPSTIEMILNTKEFSAKEKERADKIISLIKELKISKYNLVTAQSKRTLQSYKVQGKKLLLVIGQVENDKSIVYGSPHIKTNRDLLAAVRKVAPDDIILFKPHPDIVSGNRKGLSKEKDLFAHCDHIITDFNIHNCIQSCDEVHTMTSLVGFEALLFNKPVITWGLPFYAGWGLTQDKVAIKRRVRKRTLNELVAATLVDYPRYFNWANGTFTTPEYIIELLAKQKAAKKNHFPKIEPFFNKAYNLFSIALQLLKSFLNLKTYS